MSEFFDGFKDSFNVPRSSKIPVEVRMDGVTSENVRDQMAENPERFPSHDVYELAQRKFVHLKETHKLIVMGPTIDDIRPEPI